MIKVYTKYIFPKTKIRKENKTKPKIKRTNKRNTLVLNIQIGIITTMES